MMSAFKLSCLASLVFLVIAIILVACTKDKTAPTPLEHLRDAVATVEVHGFDEKGHDVADTGTGFFISKDGYFVTAKHLLDDVVAKGVTPENLTFTVKMQPHELKSGMPAVTSWKSSAGDAMVLLVKFGRTKFNILHSNLDSRDAIELGITPIFTGGFSQDYPLLLDSGIIKSFDGPENNLLPLWVTNMSFKYGQSGSPIILADGTVIAIVTAIDQDASTIGFVTPIRDIPSYYWDSNRRNLSNVK